MRERNTGLQTLIEVVNNQSSDREHGCLSMHGERLLVAEIELLRAAALTLLPIAEERALAGGMPSTELRAWVRLRDLADAVNGAIEEERVSQLEGV